MRPILPVLCLAVASSFPAAASELVPVPRFRSVELRGGGSVTVVPGPAQRVTILEGSSAISRMYVEPDGKLRIDICNGRCPQRYRLSVQIESPRVPDLAISGGGEVTVTPGFASQSELAAAVNGGGKIDTRAVDAAQVTAAVNGGGDLLVRARSALTGAVRGGGLVRYWGNPAVTSAIAGGGAIERGY